MVPQTVIEPLEIPTSARVLGWAGVLPFAALSLMTVALASDFSMTARNLLTGYGSIILGFMGGVQWGLALHEGESLTARLGASVVPALVAFVAAGVAITGSSRWALLILAVGFIGLLTYDLRIINVGLAPAWYGRLRWELTSAAVASLLVASIIG